MQTFTANQAKTHFGEFLNIVQREPAQVTRHDRVIGVMVNPEDYAAMREFFANRLQQTLNTSALAAENTGMTPEVLEALLADES